MELVDNEEVKVEKLIYDLDDDGKLRMRYNNKKIDAKKNQIGIDMSFDEFCQLMVDAGVKSSQLGRGRNDYQLARYGDDGDYVVGNCRFITQLENARERKVSDKSRENSKRSAAIMNSSRPDDIGDRIKSGQQSSEKYKALQQRKAERTAEKRAQMDQTKVGEKNSQFGTYWINNGEISMKWSDNKGAIPDGFTRGRKLKQQ
jgi:hypothetical protein